MASNHKNSEPTRGILSASGVSSEVLPTGFIPIDDAGFERERLIAEAAYKRAERRGFASGQDLEDWLAAEKEVDAEMAARRSYGPST